MYQSLVLCLSLCYFATAELSDTLTHQGEKSSFTTSPVVESSSENLINRVVDLNSLQNTNGNDTKFLSNIQNQSKDSVLSNKFSDMTLVDKLSDQVRVILKHFQEPEPVGIPGQDILTEPLYAPNTTGSMVIATGFFYNMAVWGLSNFSVTSVNTSLDNMEIYLELRIKRVLIEGNYSVNNLLISNAGPFNITLTNVTATGIVDLEINKEGKLYADKSSIDMKYENIEIVLVDIGSVLKPFVNNGAYSVFESEKSHILENIKERLIAEFNKRLDIIPKIPSLVDISPVDLAVLEGRKFVKARYEPFIITNVIDFENPFLKVHVGPVSVSGLSKFARVGNVTLSLFSETVIVGIRIITGRLFGNCKWYYDFGEVEMKRSGESNFTVQHVQIEAKVKQSVDSRKPPYLEDLQVETGPIIIKMDRNGNFDYIVEMVVKMLPRMLRYIIIDALEEPLKMKIQKEILNKISIDQVFEECIPAIKKYLSDKL